MTKSLRSVPATGFSSRTHVLKSSAESWTVPVHCWSSWLTVNVFGSSGKLNFKVSLVSRLKASSSCLGSTSIKTGTGNTTSGFSASGAEGPRVHPEIPKKKTVTGNPSLRKRIKELSFFFSDSLIHRGHTLSQSDTHCCYSKLGVLFFHLVQQGCRDPCS